MGLGIKTKLKEYLEENILANFGPTTVRLNPVGYACTNACPMCWRAMKKISKKGGLLKTEFNLEKYLQIIDSTPFTVSTIEVVGGGEPLLFPQINQIFSKIKQRKLIGSLITNGVLLNEKTSQLLINLSWDNVRVSINAGSKAIYPLANGSHYYDLVVKNIKQFLNIRNKQLTKNSGKNQKTTKLGLHYVIQKSNYLDIANFIALANELQVDYINFDNLMFDSPKAVKLTNKNNQKLIANLEKLKEKTTVTHNIEEVIIKIKQGDAQRPKSYFKNKYCQVVQTNLEISSEGATVPCCMAFGETVEGNIRDKTVKEIWQELATFRKKLKQGKFQPFCYERCNYHLKNKH